MTEPRVIEVFSDYVCPWCYLGSARVARLQKEHGVQVKFVHFPLHPDTPQEGKSLEALFAGRGYDRLRHSWVFVDLVFASLPANALDRYLHCLSFDSRRFDLVRLV